MVPKAFHRLWQLNFIDNDGPDDPTGSLGGISKALFVVGKPKGLATLKIQTVAIDLSHADFVLHDVTTQITFVVGAHQIDPDIRLFEPRGTTLVSQ